jgi:hypothetical protein
MQGTGPNAPQAVDPNGVFIGVSGISAGERIIAGQLNQAPVQSGYVSQELLPATPVGYDQLDALVLNQPELHRLQVDQQRAIADWVRAGGTVILWPGPGPLPSSGPIMDILPCKIGDNQYFQFDPAAVSRAGLPARFAKLKGRGLSNPTADAKVVPFLESTQPLAYRHWVGYGQVIIVAADISQLVFDSSEKAQDFWRELLAGAVPIPEFDPNTQNRYWENQSRRNVPLQQTLDWLGDVPGAGQFGFSYIAGTLLALMAIVGPVDWFVLKRLGRQPWTWVTITGWIGVVTCSAIYLGHVFKAGDLYFRTASIVDEAGGERVAATDIFGLYSPQTRDYEFATDPESWWRPASDNNYYGGGGLEREIACHQDYRGNRPEPMQINVWNLRYLEGEELGPAPPLLEAKLKQSGDRITGKITNRGEFPLTQIHIRTHGGVATIAQSIDPGATVDVDAKLNPRDQTLATQPVQQQQATYQRYTAEAIGSTRPAQPILSGIVDDRATQIDRMLQERNDIACVYSSYDAPTDRVKVDIPGAKTLHTGLVRALFPLE